VLLTGHEPRGHHEPHQISVRDPIIQHPTRCRRRALLWFDASDYYTLLAGCDCDLCDGDDELWLVAHEPCLW
jgi:hypothetical protein